MSRAYTEVEVRERLLRHIHAMIGYWTSLPNQTVERRLEGLAFSILVALDGGAMELPAFKVIPYPHPDDRDYSIELNEDYYPDEGDIAGSLHEVFNQYKEKA